MFGSGSHDRVYALYKKLGVDLRPAEFSYSFSRLSSTESMPTSSKSTPPPPYSKVLEPTNESTIELLRPVQTPIFLYEGKNGLSFPPFSFPSTVNTLFTRYRYVVNVVLLAIAYFHLLFLAFFYNYTGLTARKDSRRALVWRMLGWKNVGLESMESWCGRHRIGNGMRKEVLEPLYAAISTVGREEVGSLPVGEILGQSLSNTSRSRLLIRRSVLRLRCIDIRELALRRDARSTAARRPHLRSAPSRQHSHVFDPHLHVHLPS